MEKNEPTIKTIWGIAKSPELRLTDEELHLVVEQRTGKVSMKELNKREIARVSQYLIRLRDSARHQETSKRCPPTGNQGTVNQRKRVYRLMEELGWNENRVNGLCKKMFTVSHINWLNYQQCSKLIEAMKAIHARSQKEGTKNEEP